MSRASNKSLMALYWRTANAFAERARQQLGEAVHAVVLYGSVARRTAEEDSDIDVLVLSENGEAVRAELVDISESLDFDNNYDTFVIADAVASRSPESRDLALHRLRKAGAIIANSEMAIFEWLEKAGTPEFKDLLALVK